MEEKNSNNLPVEVKSKALLSNYPNVGKTLDSLRRAGAIVGSAVTMFLGLGVASMPVLPVTIAGYGVFAAGLARFTRNATLKTEPTLLFGSQKQGDEIGIYQDLLNLGTSSRMIGYDDLEKMSMMGLQTLVGFSRYKQNLKNSKEFEIDENGNKIYSQKFATLTHGINLENIKALEQLGYIKIDSMSSQFEPKSLDEKIAALTQKKGEPKRSYLIAEKIGFGNWKGARDSVKAMLFGDAKEKERNSKEMQKVTFRLTDKPIDFDEIALFAKPGYRKTLPPETEKAARKMGMIAKFMKKRQLVIEQDAFGRDRIKYPSRLENAKINRSRKEKIQENAKQRAQDKAKEKFEEQKKEFDERITEGVETEGKIIETISDKTPVQQFEIEKQSEQEL